MGDAIEVERCQVPEPVRVRQRQRLVDIRDRDGAARGGHQRLEMRAWRRAWSLGFRV